MICLQLLTSIEILKYLWARCEQKYIVIPSHRFIVENVIKVWEPPYKVIGWDKDDTQILVERIATQKCLNEFYCDSLRRLIRDE